METGVLIAIISALAALGVAAFGARVGRNLGIPTNLEEKLIGELKELNDTLEANNASLEKEVAHLKGQLKTERRERSADAEECKQRLLDTEHRLDNAEARIQRLLLRLPEDQ